jgi:secreted protein with Ig-like and vWFA domain
VPLETWIFDTFYAPWLDPRDASLLFAISWVALFLGLLTILYRKEYHRQAVGIRTNAEYLWTARKFSFYSSLRPRPHLSPV